LTCPAPARPNWPALPAFADVVETVHAALSQGMALRQNPLAAQ
jgi:hypothetical protein